jgi:hypothetical protein
MPGVAIGLQMNFGYAGTVSRTPDAIITNKKVKTGTDDIPFGAAVMLNNDNTVQLADSGFTADNFAGVAVAEVKQQTVYPLNEEEGGIYKPDQPCDYVQRGIVAVKVNRGTPTSGGAVYVRKALNQSLPGLPVGGFEAQADGGNTVEVTNATWHTGAVDANGIAELKLKTINN